MKGWLQLPSSLLLVAVLQVVLKSNASPTGRSAVTKLPNHLVDSADVEHLVGIFLSGVQRLNWREPTTDRLLHSLAKELGISKRELGDLHFEDNVDRLHAVENEHWSDMVVLYLGPELVNISSSLPSPNMLPSASIHVSREIGTSASAGTLLLVPESAMLYNNATCRLAWLRIRRSGLPRPLFDYYVASWIRANVINPHENGGVQAFLSRRTRTPQYWNEFFWSFLSSFCSGLALMLPLIGPLVLVLRAMLGENEMGSKYPSDKDSWLHLREYGDA